MTDLANIVQQCPHGLTMHFCSHCNPMHRDHHPSTAIGAGPAAELVARPDLIESDISIGGGTVTSVSGIDLSTVPVSRMPTVIQVPVGSMGVCLNCGEPYEEGDMVAWDVEKNGWVCPHHPTTPRTG